MSIFSFNFTDKFRIHDLKDNDYELMCCQFNKLVNSYIIRPEIFSKPFWDYLVDDFNIIDEKNVITLSDSDADEKNHIHKIFKYYVKCELTKNEYFYIVFNDEARGYESDDYKDYVTEEDKQNKINNIVIYYDPMKISTKIIEHDIVDKIISFSYLPSIKNQFFTISTSQYGYTLKPSYIKDIDVNLKLNYGSKFIDVYDKIMDKLKNQKHGLFLFHGAPGSGKTFFLRKLINELSEDKTFIYIPAYMMQNIADPELISFISNLENIILILEDSENILSRTIDDRTQAVANILNMTDGLLNDTMNVQIIATFNTDVKLIDPALTRAGRLMVNYKFGKLSKIDANKLAKHLGLKKSFNCPVTLSEIYQDSNKIIENDDLDNEPTRIGFKRDE